MINILVQYNIKSVNMSILKIIMVNTYCAIAASENEYIKYIKEGPGLLFDPVGTLKLIDDYLHIVIPIDVTSFDQNIKHTQDVLNIVKLQCQKTKEIDISVCQNIMQPLDSLYNDILRDYNSISHIISSERPKRSAWFSGVGVVFKHIFGTLDEDDAINYNRAIETFLYVLLTKLSINSSYNPAQRGVTDSALGSHWEGRKVVAVNRSLSRCFGVLWFFGRWSRNPKLKLFRDPDAGTGVRVGKVVDDGAPGPFLSTSPVSFVVVKMFSSNADPFGVSPIISPFELAPNAGSSNFSPITNPFESAPKAGPFVLASLVSPFEFAPNAGSFDISPMISPFEFAPNAGLKQTDNIGAQIKSNNYVEKPKYSFISELG
ncbi:unnamed protein product [Leptidea sinapis]|uniref:Uncharacterized protein n=1 Tax=Leptidea sinapis TaxID=189913 RepID=A0A5E4QRH1_9NEOP|nr:unnamed protein product [Leptidea sinapis]